MTGRFIAFVTLSNWLRGFDRYRLRYSKALIPESTFKDAFYVLREDEPFAPGLSKARGLLTKLGISGDQIVALQATLPIEAVRRNDVTGTGIGWRWPHPELPLSGVGWVDERTDSIIPARHEDVTARAFVLGDSRLAAWEQCRPRSFSVLPVANACQARCAFCFSKASVSHLSRQPAMSLATTWAWADAAVDRGAERAVITGGGEPTLYPRPRLLELVRGLATRFEKTLLITNGAQLDGDGLRELQNAGLGTLAISRHGLDAAHDARLMGLAVDSASLAHTASSLGLRTRAICVLQRQGVASAEDVVHYLRRSAREGFDEVCLKELYVSSTSENPWAPSAVNTFCASNQVPLRVVLDALTTLGFERLDELPWGSPVFGGELEGRRLRVAAYTEPSVGWERTHRLVRSWNLMADGACLASLEDPNSRLSPLLVQPGAA